MPSGHALGDLDTLEPETAALRRRTLRPDIQGLRAIAVVAVVLDHLVFWPSGGFVGVDVFFVISGFLITGLLLKEHERTGRISYLGFYRRRVRRLLPAATIVLVVTVALGFWLFNRVRAWEAFWDAASAFLFVSNWRFAAVGTDYFQADLPVSPVQQFWSLSVEEQFYLVWPWLLLGILVLARARSGSARRVIIAGAMTLIVVGTFAWALHQSVANPTVAYFSTITRAWELGVGALIAIGAPLWARIPARARPVLGWVGLVGILVAYFTIDDTLPFPAPWAALPVLATGLTIIAGTGGEQRFLFPLTNRVSRYIGDVSYSLYLWHFPVIIFVAILLPDPWVAIVTSVAVMAALTVISYHFVELPFQHLPPLGPESARSSAAWASWRRQFFRPVAVGAAVVTIVLLAVGSAVAVQPANPRPIDAAAPAETARVPDPASTASPSPQASPAALDVLRDELASALAAEEWPVLYPTLESVMGGLHAPEDIHACGRHHAAPARGVCTWGARPGNVEVLLVGDSSSLAYTHAIRTLAPDAAWTVSTRGMFGCPFIDISTVNSVPAVIEQCPAHNADVIAHIKRSRPDIVIITTTFEPLVNVRTKEVVTPEEFAEGMDAYVSTFASSVDRIAILAPPPASANVHSCYTPQSSPQDCVTTVTDRWLAVASVMTDRAPEMGALFIDSRPLLCIDRSCPPFAAATPTKLDLGHITGAYAEKIAPAMLELFEASGLLSEAGPPNSR